MGLRFGLGLGLGLGVGDWQLMLDMEFHGMGSSH